eukprot:89124-Chlamydomonas_euryale.AAC.2
MYTWFGPTFRQLLQPSASSGIFRQLPFYCVLMGATAAVATLVGGGNLSSGVHAWVWGVGCGEAK